MAIKQIRFPNGLILDVPSGSKLSRYLSNPDVNLNKDTVIDERDVPHGLAPHHGQNKQTILAKMVAWSFIRTGLLPANKRNGFVSMVEAYGQSQRFADSAEHLANQIKNTSSLTSPSVTFAAGAEAEIIRLAEAGQNLSQKVYLAIMSFASEKDVDLCGKVERIFFNPDDLSASLFREPLLEIHSNYVAGYKVFGEVLRDTTHPIFLKVEGDSSVSWSVDIIPIHETDEKTRAHVSHMGNNCR